MYFMPDSLSFKLYSFEVKRCFYLVSFQNSTRTGLILIMYCVRGPCSSLLSFLRCLCESIKNCDSQIENLGLITEQFDQKYYAMCTFLNLLFQYAIRNNI